MLRALEDAMPGPLEGSFETNVAQYMTGLFAASSEERRTSIRLAQERADQERGDSTGGTAGTMRALSNGIEDAPSVLGSAFRSRTPRWLVPLGAVAVVAACGAITVGSLRSPKETPVSGPTPAGAPGVPPPATTRAADVTPAISARPETTTEAIKEPADHDTPATEEPKKVAQGRASRGGAVRRTTSAPAATTPPATTPAPAAAAPAAPAAQPTAPDAWDRTQFGGRF
jgi:hypothetical protein